MTNQSAYISIKQLNQHKNGELHLQYSGTFGHLNI